MPHNQFGETAKPWVADDEFGLSSTKAGLAKKAASENLVVYVALAVLGVAIAAYALRAGLRTVPAETTEVPAVSAAVERANQTPSARAEPPPQNAKRTSSQPSFSTVHRANAERVTKAPSGDRLRDFETGDAFDQPSQLDGRMNTGLRRRGFSNPAPRPPKDSVNEPDPSFQNPNRPNVPDPAFRKESTKSPFS